MPFRDREKDSCGRKEPCIRWGYSVHLSITSEYNRLIHAGHRCWLLLPLL